jgi:hypothetical protein
MNRTGFIEHAGRRIVFMNFAAVNDLEEALGIIEEARRFVAAQPRDGTLLTLVDVGGSRFDERVVQALKKLAAHNRPFVLAGAVVGMTPLQRVVYRIINTFSGRRLAAFQTHEEAKEWLVRQARSAAGSQAQPPAA